MQIPNSYLMDEVRDGFYVSSMMKRYWAAGMEVLDDLDKICKENGLKWFPAFGTMLGLVRHKGFVPWDDDMDTFMFREDYDKLKELVKEGKTGKYYMSTIESENMKECLFACFYPEMMVPVYEGEECTKFHGYPFTPIIDIFPLDYLHPDEKKEDEIASIALGFRAAADMYSKDTGKLVEGASPLEAQKLVRKLEEVTGRKFVKDNTIKRQLLLAAEETIASTVKVKDKAVLATKRDHQLHYPESVFYVEDFKDTIEMDFEMMKIECPSGYDRILQNDYADYMIPKRGAAGHPYPVYREVINDIKEKGGLVYEYRYNGEDKREINREPATPKQTIRKIYNSIPGLTDAIERYIFAADHAGAIELLTDLQDLIILMGDCFEKEGVGDIIPKLEELCEKIYFLSETILGGEGGDKLRADTDSFKKTCNEAIEMIPAEILDHRHILFIPYKAEYWEAMDPVWRAAKSNEGWQVDVVPIPYYYRMVKGDMQDMVYEFGSYPSELNAVKWDEYDFEGNHPDAVITQYPYDAYNWSYTVHPAFYSESIARFAEKLIYIPWFVTDDFNMEDTTSYQAMDSYCAVPGVLTADHTIVQSENMRNVYIEKLTEFAGEETRSSWEKKIRGTGSPLNIKNPDFWNKEIKEILK